MARPRILAIRSLFPALSTVQPSPQFPLLSTTSFAMAKKTAPYGRWESPITSDLIVKQNISFGEIKSFFSAGATDAASRETILWTENRPQEKGRAALIQASVTGSTSGSSAAGSEQDLPHSEDDLTGGDLNARSGVHEYGGGAAGVGIDGSVIFTDYNPAKWDVYRVAPGTKGPPQKVSPQNPALRFGAFYPHPKRPELVLSVLEDHTHDTPSTVLNSLVVLDTSTKGITQIASGADFYAYPSFSPGGDLVTWVQWDHPSMPWWDSQVHVARFDLEQKNTVGKSVALPRAKTPDGGEVQQQPRWQPGKATQSGADTLFFTSDRTGFSNLYKVDIKVSADSIQASEPKLLTLEPITADMHQPLWILSTSTYAFLTSNTIAVVLTHGGSDSLALIDADKVVLLKLDFDFTFKTFKNLHATSSNTVVAVVESDDAAAAIVRFDLSESLKALSTASRGTTLHSVSSAHVSVIKRTSNVVKDGTVGKEWLGPSEDIEFETKLPNGTKYTAYAVLYPPQNPNYEAPEGTSPPCRITVHGGPTSAAQGGMSLETVYWTSRGWTVCSVNYAGSTGYGRQFMNRMLGEWGVVDVEDCIAAARYLGSPASAKAASTSNDGKKNRELYESPTAKQQLACYSERTYSDGTVEVTLQNPKQDWSVIDAVLAAGFLASAIASFFLPGIIPQASILGGAALWLGGKLFKVQEETVKAIPGVGLQKEAKVGFRSPFNDRPGAFTTLSHKVSFTPRDRIVDLVINEVLKGWSVQTFVTAITVGDKLQPLFSTLQPRLPLVQRIYQALHPVVMPSGPSPSAQSKTGSSSAVPRADPKKMVISGGSSGGYTVLAALCLYPDVFSAACSRYGISELTALAHDSHKFESKYPFRLLGGLPDEVPEIYRGRSPLYMADRIRAPLLIEQGELDLVVPPSQSEGMVETIKRNGGEERVKYILFEGEGHGFRQAANKKRALEEELQWYEDVLFRD